MPTKMFSHCEKMSDKKELEKMVYIFWLFYPNYNFPGFVDELGDCFCSDKIKSKVFSSNHRKRVIASKKT